MNLSITRTKSLGICRRRADAEVLKTYPIKVYWLVHVSEVYGKHSHLDYMKNITDLEFCIDCKCYHSIHSFAVKREGKFLGKICQDCNLARIRRLTGASPPTPRTPCAAGMQGYLFPTTDEEIERAIKETEPKINRASICGITTHYEAFCPVCKTVFAKRRHRKSLSAYLQKHQHHCQNIPDVSVFIHK